MSFTPSTTFGKWAYIAMRKGRLSHVRHEQEINRLASRGISRMKSNSWFLLHNMERLHGVGAVKKKEMMR